MEYFGIIFGSIATTVAALGGAIVAWRRLKPQEKSDIAGAVQALSSAAATLVAPLEDRIKSLESKIVALEVIISDQKTEIRALRNENGDLRNKISHLENGSKP